MRRIYFFYGLELESSDPPKSRRRLKNWLSSIREYGNRKSSSQTENIVLKEIVENNY